MNPQQNCPCVDNKTPSRRLFLQSAGVASTIMIAGCSGDDSSEEESPDDSTDDGTSDDSSDDSTDDGTSDGSSDDSTDDGTSDDSADDDTSDEEKSVFVNYGIDGTDLSVELTEDSLSQVAVIRVETPSEEKTTEVSETITEYSVDVLRDRAGTWFIDALDTDDEIIETVELETTFDVSVDEIGTLAQLGVTGESPEAEHASYQLTVANNGDVPAEPREIELFVPNLYDYDETATISSTDIEEAIVDRDGETVITASNDNTYLYRANTGTSGELLVNLEAAEEKAGQSFDGEITIMYEAERQDTVVPVTIELGDELIEDTVYPILRGTVINKR